MRTINSILLMLCLLLMFLAINSWNSINGQATSQQLRLSAAANDAAGVRAALEAGASSAERVSVSGDIAILVQQIRFGNQSVVSELLKNSSQISAQLRATALSTALKQPDGEMLNLLLTAGWEPDAASLAQQVVWLRKEDTRLQQLQSRWPNTVQEALNISLREALQKGSLPQTERAMAAGAKLSTIISAGCCFSEQRSFAATNGNRVPITLVKPYGQELGALQTAASKGASGGLTAFLLAQGLPVDSQDNDGKTALMWALWERNYDNAMTLLAAGATPNIVDKQGRNAMMYAVLPTSDTRFGDGFISMGGGQTSSFTVHGITGLLKSGLDPLMRDKDGRNALDYATLVASDKSEATELSTAWSTYQAKLEAAKDQSAVNTETTAN